MTHPKFRTVLIGFGQVGEGYANDPLMARHYPYASHAQVLAQHSHFSWDAVVDLSEAALTVARERWGIPLVAKTLEVVDKQYRPEVAVIATPPATRLALLEQMPGLRAVLVEKPLCSTVAEGQQFLDYCQQHHIQVQVNLWRRADETFRSLAAGELSQLIGQPQAVFGLYGRGLLNNATHLVDFVRMLLGEIEAVQAVGGVSPYPAGPLPDDVNLPFNLRLGKGVVVTFQPLRFEQYRENSLDIWGEKGRLQIVQEGLSLLLHPRQANRAMQGEGEIASDYPQLLTSTVGQAFYRMYSNLAAALQNEDELWSPGTSALQTAKIVQAILDSAANGGMLREIG
jgi:predicted dehydrogenase